MRTSILNRQGLLAARQEIASPVYAVNDMRKK